MPGMQNVEAAIRENDLFAARLKNADCIGHSLSGSNHTVRPS